MVFTQRPFGHTIARNQVFLDGNKRTALVVCRTFLLLNNQALIATNEEKYHAIIKLAEGLTDVDQMADWIRSHMQKPR